MLLRRQRPKQLNCIKSELTASNMTSCPQQQQQQQLDWQSFNVSHCLAAGACHIAIAQTLANMSATASSDSE